MFKLIKFLVVMALLAALALFAFLVPLGKMTLWEHLVGISETDEAKDLGSELENKAVGIKDEVGKHIPEISLPEKKKDPEPAKPPSNLTDDDKEELIKLLKKKSN